MSFPQDASLAAYVKYLEAINPASVQVYVSENESDFIAAVERAIEHTVIRIESAAKLHCKKSEPDLSWLLVELLDAASIPTTAETYHNGHADVTVKHPRHAFIYLGECKLYRGPQHHSDGVEQLLRRYASGRFPRGFCLDFFQVDDMYPKLDLLRAWMTAEMPHAQIGAPWIHPPKGAFLTAHKHFTGSHVEVLHLGCNAYHPEAKP